MSRIAKQPVVVPTNVEVIVKGQLVTVKGSKGLLERNVHETVVVKNINNQISFDIKENAKNWAQAGTERSLINNMVIGVSSGYEKKLTLIGVGYRAKMANNLLNLTLGFSHDINFEIPEGIEIKVPSQTEVVISGSDKQQVGETAAKIRAFRRPEPYKGKGVRYSDEYVRRKEVKKS